MADRTTLLPMPAAIDAAYLLLIGQLCLALSKLAFGAAYVTEHDLPIDLISRSSVIWGLSAVVVLMLFVNILSCWRSTRSTFEEIGHYPNELLTSDVMIIVAFFFLGSVASAPVGFMSSVTMDTPSITQFVQSLQNLWEPVVPLVFFASALLVLAYRSWNKSYLKVLREEEKDPEVINTKALALESFNSLYSFFAIVFTAFGVALLVFENDTLTVISLLVWVGYWAYINFFWMLKPPPEAG